MRSAAGSAIAALLILFASSARAEEPETNLDQDSDNRGKRIIYKKNTQLDFDGLAIDGELKNPAEFYFENRPQEKFGTLVTRRKNFHREMLRDAVMSK